ncbi:MAG: hypothetical protein ACI9TY_001372 [Alphaproteobacteria bacterium]
MQPLTYIYNRSTNQPLGFNVSKISNFENLFMGKRLFI